MNDLVKTNERDWLTEFAGMSTEELKHELADSLGLTARSLTRSALLVKLLEERGEDLSGLKISLIHHLRKIACGQLLPEVVVRFAGKPSLITAIGSLPIEDQRRLSSGEPIRLVVLADGGGRTHRMADPLEMTPDQVRQAFAPDHIRNDAEQNLILDGKNRLAHRPVPEVVGPLKLDLDRDGVIHKGEFIPFDTLAGALKLRRRK